AVIIDETSGHVSSSAVAIHTCPKIAAWTAPCGVCVYPCGPGVEFSGPSVESTGAGMPATSSHDASGAFSISPDSSACVSTDCSFSTELHAVLTHSALPAVDA